MNKFLISLCLLCSSAHAEFMDGNRLISDMRSNSVASQMFAMGYVSGVFDMGRGFFHCAPAQATIGQVNDMVQNYLTQMPGERNKSADVLVNRVLATQWPCPKKGNTL